jgi:uncharacterized Fe-S radical SAM superfamily protein PflX
MSSGRWWLEWEPSYLPPSNDQPLRIAGSDLTMEMGVMLEAFAHADQPSTASVARLPRSSWTRLNEVGSGVSATRQLSGAALLRAHRAAMNRLREGRASTCLPGEVDLLELKRRCAHALSSPCRTCSWRCGARRAEGQVGRCGAGPVDDTRVVNLQVVRGEEDLVSPTLAVWFAGCPERCVGCLYAEAISARAGQVAGAGEIAARLVELAATGTPAPRSLMIVGGNPDVHLARTFDVLCSGAPDLPVVWNGNGQSTAASLSILDGVVGAYLLDLKFRTQTCADANHAAGLALARVAPAIHHAARQRVPVVLRLLVRPGHIDCCAIPLVNVAATYARRYASIYFHPLFGWLPVADAARNAVQGRPLTPLERAGVERAIALNPILAARRVSAAAARV